MKVAEAEKVENWRIEQFIRIGFDSEQAIHLAQQDVDLRTAERFIKQGCPPELVARILV